jgi:hypothetical protein
LSYAIAAYVVGIVGVAAYAIHLARERRLLLDRLGRPPETNRG